MTPIQLFVENLNTNFKTFFGLSESEIDTRAEFCGGEFNVISRIQPHDAKVTGDFTLFDVRLRPVSRGFETVFIEFPFIGYPYVNDSGLSLGEAEHLIKEVLGTEEVKFIFENLK